MYENGGNTFHRFLDGHPELFVYPFESQLGNARISDYLTSFYPFKYRWPDFPVSSSSAEDYELFFDEEFKTRIRVPHVSKFRGADLQVEKGDRKQIFVELMEGRERTRGNIVATFFEATFQAWKNVKRTGQEKNYVGYSPIIGIDAERILGDFPNGRVIHVVRNPWSGFADTIKRPFPLSLERYALSWAMLQHLALVYRERFPDRMLIVRFEDLVSDTENTMRQVANCLGVEFHESFLQPSWNGEKMEQVYPWGTVRTPTPEANIATMNELNSNQKNEIASYCSVMIERLGYADFMK